MTNSTYLNGLDLKFVENRKFKKGDTVVINDRFTGAAKAGATAEVVGYDKGSYDDNTYLRVVWKRDGLAGHQQDGLYWEHNFDLAESARPRFMTAWIVDGDDAFKPTGEAFKSLEAAEANARQTLLDLGVDDQIAVFEIRSVFLARLNVTKEAA